MATTVHVHNISTVTNEAAVRDFFSFCGKIQSLSLTPTGEVQSAAVTFEKPTAAKTALLLDNTQLGPNVVNVSAAQSLEEMSYPKDSSGEGATATSDHVDQEDKPRSRIVAEYLAHGYTISDQAIERAIALDKQHGISNRFTTALTQFDQKYKASDKALEMDQKYGVSEKAYAGWQSLNSYFEKALETPTGQRVRSFYTDGQKQVLDVHNEARRLADLKTGRSPTSPTTATTGDSTSSYEHNKANLETVPGTERTKCTCGGAEGVCPCEPGKCACSTCHKNPDVTKIAA